MSQIRVAVLRGGPSSHYDDSLETGGAMLKHIAEEHLPQDIFIDKDGTWHREGFPISPEKVFQNADIVLNALHGTYGEDGTVHETLEAFQPNYSGSGRLAARVAGNRALLKKIYRSHGLRTPYAGLISREARVEEMLPEIFRSFPLPAHIHPVQRFGTEVKSLFAKDFHSLGESLQKLFETEEQVVAEEYISGPRAICAVLEDFRGQKLYAFLPAELIVNKNENGEDSESLRYPGGFSREHVEQIEDLAKRAHTALGAKHYSLSSFVVHPKRGVYILETRLLPPLHPKSHFAEFLGHVGSNISQFLNHIIHLTKTGK